MPRQGERGAQVFQQQAAPVGAVSGPEVAKNKRSLMKATPVCRVFGIPNRRLAARASACKKHVPIETGELETGVRQPEDGTAGARLLVDFDPR